MSSSRFEKLLGFFPQISKPRGCKPEFNWFLFSQRRLDEKTNLFYISIPPTTRFFSERLYTTMNVIDTSTETKKMKTDEHPRLLLLNDVHNKRRLCSMYGECIVGCTSKKSKLSKECELVSNAKRVARLSRLSVKLGFDGVATHHVSCKPGIRSSRFPLCTEATFIILKKRIQYTPVDGCRMVRYAKLHNTVIRRKIKSFPTNAKIDEMMKEKGCRNVTKILYKQLLRYSTPTRKLKK